MSEPRKAANTPENQMEFGWKILSQHVEKIKKSLFLEGRIRSRLPLCLNVKSKELCLFSKAHQSYASSQKQWVTLNLGIPQKHRYLLALKSISASKEIKAYKVSFYRKELSRTECAPYHRPSLSRWIAHERAQWSDWKKTIVPMTKSSHKGKVDLDPPELQTATKWQEHLRSDSDVG